MCKQLKSSRAQNQLWKRLQQTAEGTSKKSHREGNEEERLVARRKEDILDLEFESSVAPSELLDCRLVLPDVSSRHFDGLLELIRIVSAIAHELIK